MSSRRIATVAAAWVMVLGSLIVWIARTPMTQLREQLRAAQFWSLEVCVALGIVLGVAVARELRRDFLTSRDRLQIVGPVALAIILTVLVAPRTNRIYYDEQIYQSIGQNLADLRLAQMCNSGIIEYGRLECSIGEYNKQPYAYPHVLSVAYRLFGVHEATAFAVNALAMAAIVLAVYLLTWALFEDRLAAWFAALIMAMTPQQIVWSATAAVEPSASLACVAALLCAALFLRSNSTVALAATACSAAYATQFRPEAPLVLPIIGLLLWRTARTEIGRMRFWWCALLFVALAAANIGHLAAVRNEDWGTSEARLSLAYVLPNLRVNGWFYLGDWRFPIVFTFLAIAGLFGRRFVAARLAMLGYFALFFGIGLLFYAGSYNYGADVRYSLLTYPPIAVLGGLGARQLSAFVHRITHGNSGRAVVASALAFQFLWYLPGVRATTQEAWAARADVRFARSFVRNLPRNSFVLTHNPGMFHVWGTNAGQMSLMVSNPMYLDQLSERFAGGIYLHWNFWCNVADPVQREFCRLALSRAPAALVSEYRERDYRYAIYRIHRASTVASKD
jgi:4-amino-4-deoxy-L-arabinose transferase-like glycosyltransferase